MEWKILLFYVYSTMKIIISTGATKLSVPGDVIQQIPLGTVLHLGINGTSPNYVITMTGVNELTLYLDKTLPSNCCWVAVVNTTGVLSSCNTEHMRICKNPFEMKVQPQNKTCNEKAGLNLVINSKRCPGSVIWENDKNWYIPGSNVVGNCKDGNGSGRENFTCNSDGAWQPSGNCYAFTDFIIKPTTTTTNAALYSKGHIHQLPPTKHIEQTSFETLRTSAIPGLPEFSTKISLLPNISTLSTVMNDTYLLSANNTNTVGTFHLSSMEYKINQSLPREYFSSSHFSQSLSIGQEIQGSFMRTNSYLHSEELFTSFDQYSVLSTSFSEPDTSSVSYFQSESIFTSFDQHSILSTTAGLVNSSSPIKFSHIPTTSAVPEKITATLNVASQNMIPSLTSDFSQQAVIKSLNTSSMQHKVFKESSFYLSTAEVNGNSTLGSFVNTTPFELYNSNVSIEVSVDIFDNHTPTNNYHNPKNSDIEHPNSDIALGVTIVFFVGIVIVILTMIFRVIWKTRDKKDLQQVIQNRKFADVAPLAQFRESIETHHVFGENLSCIDLGEVNESNTDDDVSSPGNSESSSRAEEVNDTDVGHTHSVAMASNTTCNTKLKTFTIYNNRQNNSFRHNYNQKVGACKSLKTSLTQNEIRHTTGKNNDVYALSYKHKSKCLQSDDER